jgi:hypothetical protein
VSLLLMVMSSSWKEYQGKNIRDSVVRHVFGQNISLFLLQSFAGNSVHVIVV